MIITNLFSIFDPSLGIFSFSWLILFLSLLFFPVFYWLGRSRVLFFLGFLSMVSIEINYVLKNPVKGAYGFLRSIFLLVAFYNFLALFPHLFSVTSHLLVTLPLSYSF